MYIRITQYNCHCRSLLKTEPEQLPSSAKGILCPTPTAAESYWYTTVRLLYRGGNFSKIMALQTDINTGRTVGGMLQPPAECIHLETVSNGTKYLCCAKPTKIHTFSPLTLSYNAHWGLLSGRILYNARIDARIMRRQHNKGRYKGPTICIFIPTADVDLD